MTAVQEAPGERLAALDIFRGLAVIGMMMVDWPGNWDVRFPIFEHSAWTGVTTADVIFPAFLFLMGVSVPLSGLAGLRDKEGAARAWMRILRRAAVLFLLGLFLNACWSASPSGLPPGLSTFRWMGVLQRFALVYPVVAFAVLHLDRRRIVELVVAILVGYWVLLARVPVPGFGPPDLWRMPQGAELPNLATWVDHVVLGAHVDPGAAFDPEGLLSTLPAMATGLLGALAGLWLRRRDIPLGERVNTLFVWGVALSVLGALWGHSFPLSKKLWTSSFVLLMAGWDLLALAALLWVLDLKGRSWRLLAIPRWYGANALGAMVLFTFIDNVMSRWRVGLLPDGRVLVLKDALYGRFLRPFLLDRHASWVYSCLAILALSLLFRLLHRRNWLVRA